MNYANKVVVFAALLSLFFVSLAAHTQSPAQQKALVESWNQPFKPYRIIGNIYYVGTNNLACYLITTPAGYILLDTALEESAPIIRANVATLGFKLNSIRIILRAMRTSIMSPGTQR